MLFNRPDTRGKAADSNCLNVGRHAQIIPKLVSMIVHMMQGIAFHVVSRLEVALSSVFIRRIEVTHTLSRSQPCIREKRLY